MVQARAGNVNMRVGDKSAEGLLYVLSAKGAQFQLESATGRIDLLAPAPLKLVRFPARSPLPIAALPSMSLSPKSSIRPLGLTHPCRSQPCGSIRCGDPGAALLECDYPQIGNTGILPVSSNGHPAWSRMSRLGSLHDLSGWKPKLLRLRRSRHVSTAV
jgi:hypothetical protein